MTVPLDIELSSEPDLHLDAMLMRLYARHLDAEGDAREELHWQIMAVIREQAVRLERWLVERGAPSVR